MNDARGRAVATAGALALLAAGLEFVALFVPFESFSSPATRTTFRLIHTLHWTLPVMLVTIAVLAGVGASALLSRSTMSAALVAGFAAASASGFAYRLVDLIRDHPPVVHYRPGMYVMTCGFGCAALAAIVALIVLLRAGAGAPGGVAAFTAVAAAASVSFIGTRPRGAPYPHARFTPLSVGSAVATVVAWCVIALVPLAADRLPPTTRLVALGSIGGSILLSLASSVIDVATSRFPRGIALADGFYLELLTLALLAAMVVIRPATSVRIDAGTTPLAEAT